MTNTDKARKWLQVLDELFDYPTEGKSLSDDNSDNGKQGGTSYHIDTNIQ